VRLVPLLLVLCVTVLYLRARSDRDVAQAGAAQVRELPAALQDAFAAGPDARAVLRSSGALPGPGATSPGAAPFADVGPRAALRRVRHDIRRDLAELNRAHTGHRLKVLGYDGIFISGPRALAQVVYRRSLRAPSGRYLARAPQTRTVTLVREGGRWRFVRGFETR
jgi:hypothetical protein